MWGGRNPTAPETAGSKFTNRITDKITVKQEEALSTQTLTTKQGVFICKLKIRWALFNPLQSTVVEKEESGLDAWETSGDIIRNRIPLSMEGEKWSLLTFIEICI